jgi:hypothetical protein
MTKRSGSVSPHWPEFECHPREPVKVMADVASCGRNVTPGNQQRDQRQPTKPFACRSPPTRISVHDDFDAPVLGFPNTGARGYQQVRLTKPLGGDDVRRHTVAD